MEDAAIQDSRGRNRRLMLGLGIALAAALLHGLHPELYAVFALDPSTWIALASPGLAVGLLLPAPNEDVRSP